MDGTIEIKPITARSLPGIQDDLVDLLRESVNGGATVGFLPPLSTRGGTGWSSARRNSVLPRRRTGGTGPRSPRSWCTGKRGGEAWDGD